MAQKVKIENGYDAVMPIQKCCIWRKLRYLILSYRLEFSRRATYKRQYEVSFHFHFCEQIRRPSSFAPMGQLLDMAWGYLPTQPSFYACFECSENSFNIP